MEKIIISAQQLVSLRPGEKIVIGEISIRRAGILWVVRKGDQRRSFERASLTAEWVNKEAAKLEKEKDVPVEKRAADGRVLEKQLYNTSRKTRRKRAKEAKRFRKHEKKALKAKKKEELKIKKEKKVKDRQEKRKINRVRRFFDYLIYTMSWLLLAGIGFVVFGYLKLFELPENVNEIFTQLLSHIETWDNNLVFSVFAGAAVLGIGIFLLSLISLQLHRTRLAKAWGIVLGLLMVGGVSYTLVTKWETFKTMLLGLKDIEWISFAAIEPVTQLSVILLTFSQLLFVPLLGWKRKE
ncbi:MAG: hypothetical protein M0R38_10230 [Bacteroidia bacterium]|nr:hypothetical protein [Bacteroidia bacterium]